MQIQLYYNKKFNIIITNIIITNINDYKNTSIDSFIKHDLNIINNIFDNIKLKGNK